MMLGVDTLPGMNPLRPLAWTTTWFRPCGTNGPFAKSEPDTGSLPLHAFLRYVGVVGVETIGRKLRPIEIDEGNDPRD